MVTQSSILDWKISMDRGVWQAIVHGVAKSQTRLSMHTSSSYIYKCIYIHTYIYIYIYNYTYTHTYVYLLRDLLM